MKKILVIGSVNIDISVTATSFPKKGETIIGNSLKYSYGGKGANQAITCGKLGADVKFLACVGDDSKGREVVEYLGNNGVDVSKIKFSRINPTGTAIITIDSNGDNNIVVIQGANAECDAKYLEENENEFSNCDIVLLQMEIPIDAIEKAIILASKHGKQIILNPAPANNDLNKSLYKYIDYMTPNETECAIMSDGEVDLNKAIKKIKDLGVKNVIVTLGEEGSMLYKNEKDITKVPTDKVKAIDTVAAGDCFNGAFAKALAEDIEEKKAMRFANRVSAITVTRSGAQESIPTKVELDSLGVKYE